jgi:3-hydroxy-9,10-secoandrosta-1,3,5(10)-triene-9,17-dione monooxygenase reductase component
VAANNGAVTIHATDPFATPDDARSPVRQLRGRLPAAVTIWTAYGRDDRPAGLTVSSTVVVEGDPGHVLGVLDEESELYEAVRSSGRFAVQVLRDGDGQLSDRFAGLLPAPGGLFADGVWERSEFGPIRRGLTTWAGCALTQARPLGWGLLVEATLDRIVLGEDAVPALVRYRGRYLRGDMASG